VKKIFVPLLLGALALTGCPSEKTAPVEAPPSTDTIKDVLKAAPDSDATPTSQPAADATAPAADATTSVAVPLVTYYAFKG
jgi:hypothetical protein